VQKPQSDSIVEALKAQGTPYEYHVFEGEGHGFRKPENIEAYYDLTLKFLTQYVLYA
jgi:dipeptidyl aminopeptidase/acylaminoacyl peptidase